MKKHLSYHSLSLPITPCHSLILLFLLSPFTLMAQEMTVQAPKSVFLGDNFTVQFVVNDEASDFRGPSFKGFSLRSGPNPNRMSYSTNFNGKVTNTLQYSFSYTLTADREGTFTVAPATCTSKGKKLSSESFSIKVVKPTPAQQQQRQQQQQQRRRASFDPFDMFDPWGQQQQQQQQQQPPRIDESSLFARASVSKSNPYQGEQIIVTYKIYTQVPVRQFAIDKLPGNKGFWAEDLTPDNQQVRQHEETIDGRRYQVAEIRRGALFPQQSGSLSIEPLDLNVLALVQNQRRRTGTLLDLFDDPFFNTAQAVERPLHTKKINLSVKPLPSSPDDFSGAVGTFSVKGGLSLDSVKAGEAVSYRLTLSGRGNLMLINPPSPRFPSSFETYDPQVQDKINRNDNGISGSRTYEWVLIPRQDGSFTIPAYKFIYFDPASGQYKTLTVDSQTIQVLPGANQATNQANKHSDNQAFKHSNNGFTYLLYFLSLLALVFILLTLVRWLKRRQSRNHATSLSPNPKNALRLARRRLKKAAVYMKKEQAEPFYHEIYRALWGCLSDKYNIPLSQLNQDTVKASLLEKEIPEQQLQHILQLLDEVNLARFAPGDPATHMQHLYRQALNVISEI